MKKIILLSAIVSTMVIASEPAKPVVEKAAVPAVESQEYGKFTANLRAQYFTRTFDDKASIGVIGKPDATAFTAGGILKYESAEYAGLRFGVAYYGSHRVGTFFTREEGKATSMLDANGDDLAFIGEAYLEYALGDLNIKVGRQRLATPLANDRDLRMLPTSYEAAVVRYSGISDTNIEAAYISRTSGFTSKYNGFEDDSDKYGLDGIGYVYITNKSIENLALSIQWGKALSDLNSSGGTIDVSDYFYADMNYDIAYGDKSYFKAQTGGNIYNSESNSFMYGAKVGTTVSNIDLALVFNQIKDNNFKTIQAGPMYTDWQQGYGNYEPSTAFGGQVTFKPLSDLSLKFGYVVVNAEEDSTIDDYSEFNFDGKYAFNNYSSLRVRYSFKDQTDISKRESRDDFRIIYYMNF
ncbi:hypothetical protein MNB_SV-5-806 [hydrothermal vent metagenome]|uniref:Outer membrane porin, OprD family n=1 Tax=hydrothermal vent metagenome TaxID=652676 RepID=A0A1W1ECJ7_9ZZZZ